MKNPKVVFEVGKVKDYIDVLEYFILRDGLFVEVFDEKYPDLMKSLKGIKDKEGYIKKYFEKQEEKFLPVMPKVKKDFEELWDCNDKIMKALEEINEIKWSNKPSKFKARITLNPISPRHLKGRSFDVFFGLPDSLLKTLVLHEISHFIFFEKIKKIYPDIDTQEFEAPYLMWKLSEIIPWIVLKDKRITDIFEPHEIALVYPFIPKIWIGGKKLLDILQEFYDSRKDSADFVKKSYNFLKLNIKEIDKYF